MYIRVKVKAGMKKESFVKISENRFEISVKEKAQHNMANKRIVELVAQYFNLDVKKIRIVSGQHHPAKLLCIDFD